MNKYRNIKTVVDGRTFDSRKEAQYYRYYSQMQKEGKISNLRMQVSFELIPAIYEDKVVHLKTKDKITRTLVQRKVAYVADFVYDTPNEKDVVIDVKGKKTKEYLLKKKMMRAFKGITIHEV